jgi:hypothetical protein
MSPPGAGRTVPRRRGDPRRQRRPRRSHRDGRHGIAVQRIVHGTSQQLIFDPATFAFIGEREVAISAASALKPGTILDSAAVLRVAIVSRIGQPP